MPVYPIGSDIQSLVRGDLVLIRKQPSSQTSLFLVNHAFLDSNCGFTRIYGIDLNGVLDFRNDFPPSQNDFLKDFLATPNSQDAVDSLREEVLDPVLTLGGTIPGLLLELKPHPALDVYLKTFAGAVRDHLTGQCPFPCSGHYIYASKELLDTVCPDLFDSYAEDKREAIKTLTCKLVHVPCPGCFSYEVVKECFLYFFTLSKAAPPAEITEEDREYLKVLNASVAYKISAAKAQLGIFAHAYPVSQTVTPPKINWNRLLSLKYEVWQAAKERVLVDKCAICKFVPYEKGDLITALPCCHFFHKDCLAPWLVANDTCPLCHEKISPRKVKGPPKWPPLP